MELRTHFADLLDQQQPDLAHSEALWDRRAAEVSQFTVADDDFALATLAHKLELKDSTVLEISFGGGRHLLEFARRGARVCGVEISANMIAHTRKKFAASGLACADEALVQSSWEALELAAHGWEQAFDLVFLYMSPAISSTAMLEKVLAASRAHVHLTLYCDRSDRLLGELQDEFGLPRQNVGSRGADDLYHIFNLLYQWGYFPEIRYEERSKHSRFEVDYILERYAGWLWRESVDEARRAALRRSLQARAARGELHTDSRDLIGHLLLDKRLRARGSRRQRN